MPTVTRRGERKPDSVASRLLGFFKANPDEELTLEQAMTKFDASRNAIDMAVMDLVHTGELERVRVLRLPAKGRAS